MKKDGIKIAGYRGTWYVIGTAYYRANDDYKIYLLEHEQYGDTTEHLIVYINAVTNDIEILLDDVWNGFDDYVEYAGIDEEDLIIKWDF